MRLYAFDWGPAPAVTGGIFNMSPRVNELSASEWQVVVIIRLTLGVQRFASLCEADATLNNIERNIPKMRFNDFGDDIVQRGPGSSALFKQCVTMSCAVVGRRNSRSRSISSCKSVIALHRLRMVSTNTASHCEGSM